MQTKELLCKKLINDNDLQIPSNLNLPIDLTTCPESECSIKIFSSQKLTLSTIIPVFNDLGFVVVNEVTFIIDNIYITKLFFDSKNSELLKKHFDNIKQILLSTLNGEIKNGKLFELVLYEDFCLRAILLFRAFVAYSKNLIDDFSEKDLVDCLVKYHQLSGEILDYFLTKFDPKISDRISKVNRIESRIDESLKDIKDINDDRIMRIFFKIIQNITRSNFFMDKEMISFKFNLYKLKKYLTGIEPNIESFVYSQNFLGLHLRVSKVSRGGIRWSTRKDDFRKEIKSLMITQEAKNAIIVPRGAKGGFIILEDMPISKEKFIKYYSQYINSLLDLIDNQQKKQFSHPNNMICYDEYDSYFVVAADRGTSNMSDIANNIAIKRGFWLKDAFASGSSTGYHHKKLGVTAKGALKSVQNYFQDNNIDFYKESISIIGIGSMNGDVFGNGMLESNKFKLIGAISHDEIFVDPNPNPLIAYEERKRLFFIDKGKWSKYNTNKISKGGGVFQRNSKKITLSNEIKNLLNIDKEYLSGEELVKELLCLNVDMLYFGGIGTYIKSSNENNLTIGDKENEYVRVDANMIKAKTICEGANLAITMAGRIEYALNGGFINLDSIDNAAGVNISDHEVNYKILLDLAIEDNIININEKIQLLHNLNDYVLNKVLFINHLQSLVITKEQLRSEKNLKIYKKVIRILESKMEIFKREFFLIPKERDFDEIVDKNGRLVRPVLATILLYSKILLQDILLNSEKLENKIYNKYLFQYFPDIFIEKFKNQIKAHPLKKEIISMVIANKIINDEGIKIMINLDNYSDEEFLNNIIEKILFK